LRQRANSRQAGIFPAGSLQQQPRTNRSKLITQWQVNA
jgi:hypothetical protein